MKNFACNSNSITDFLADNLSASEQVVFENHLNECDACCAELHRRTADVSVWGDARRFLNSEYSDVADACGSPGSFHRDQSGGLAWTDEIGINQPESRPRLDFLAATDDPRMLGRFAGYEISGVVGCGGMGIVLKGFDAALNRYAAIKVLAPHFASSGAARQRFAREAQAAAAVVHDNVIAIHGVSEFNDLPYLVMPYVKGKSLQKRIDRDGPLAIEEILRIAMQTARGLAAAHDQGLVHRDIKPGNILLPDNVERVLITDFGLARAADDASLTRSGVIAGTPQYMSPEQARGEALNHRSDLFSLGCVIYSMATGHSPFRAETPYGILRRITDTVHRPLQDIRSDIPRWLCLIVDRLLEKDAARRFASANEVASLLESCLAHVRQPVEVPLPLILMPPSCISRRPSFTRMLAFCALVICIGIVAFYASRTTSNSARDQTAPEVRTTNGSSPPIPVESGDGPVEPEAPENVTENESELEWQIDDKIDDFEASLRTMATTFDDDDLKNSKSKGVRE